MTKILYPILGIAVAFALAACSSGGSSSPTPVVPPIVDMDEPSMDMDDPDPVVMMDDPIDPTAAEDSLVAAEDSLVNGSDALSTAALAAPRKGSVTQGGGNFRGGADPETLAHITFARSETEEEGIIYSITFDPDTSVEGGDELEFERNYDGKGDGSREERPEGEVHVQDYPFSAVEEEFGTIDRRLSTDRFGTGADDSRVWKGSDVGLSTSSGTLTFDSDGTTHETGVPDAVGYVDVFLVEWNDDDPANYMAGGWWFYIEKEEVLEARATDEPADYQWGVFLDGVETDFSSYTLPTAGTATYEGHAFGTYGHNMGNALSGFGRVGSVFADADLTADFGEGTMSGELSNFIFSVNPIGFADAGNEVQLTDLAGNSDNAQVILSPASFDAENDNFFKGDSLASGFGVQPLRENFEELGAADNLCPDTCREELVAMDAMTGKWGGEFFGQPADTDAPPQVGGTWGVQQTNEDGTFLAIIGVFGAENQDDE